MRAGRGVVGQLVRRALWHGQHAGPPTPLLQPHGSPREQHPHSPVVEALGLLAETLRKLRRELRVTERGVRGVEAGHGFVW